MRPRKKQLGTRNIIGHRITQARLRQNIKQIELLARIQIKGIEITASGLSKIEGQVRLVTDFELAAIADALNVSVDWLFGRTK